ncbi:MAG: GTPase ObgE [Clostridia bacterium]|nr:GTPase ObgE [Clostridia bacterium]
MFVDKVSIYIKAGNGGNGAATFRREKFVPNGGPDGGDGGKGGSIIFKTEEGMTTLYDYKNYRKFRAEDGAPGTGGNCHGKDAKDLIIKVPVGTVVREETTGKVICDLNEKDMEYVILKGGRGGLGNQHFATSRRQAPRYAEKGEEGKELNVILEIKMIADVGLVGFPNAGKSTILSVVTNANPKIGAYQFTTLIPNLGVVKTRSGKSFLMADIPGLIEDAHKGVGLGHEFLKHVERTKVLVHVVDVAGTEGRNPLVDIMKINNELELYSDKLGKKTQILALNKIDVLEDDKIINEIKDEHPDVKVFPISAVAHKGLDDLFDAVAEELEHHQNEETKFKQEFFIEDMKDPYQDAPYIVEKLEDEVFEISGRGVDRMMGYTAIDTEKGFAFLQKYLEEKGIIDALKEKGIKEGDTVYIGNQSFIYYE